MNSPASKLHLLALSLFVLVALFAATCLAGDRNDPIVEAAEETGEQPQTARSKFTLPKLFDFEFYKTRFKKRYASLVDEAARAKLYLARAFRAFVSAVGYKYRKASTYLAINHMSDWTPEELHRLRLRPKKDTDKLQGDRAGEQEPLPAVSMEELKQELEDIVEQGDQQPSIKRMMAEELNESSAAARRHSRKRRNIARQISMDDIMGHPDDGPKQVGQRVENNNPFYEAPELMSFGSSDNLPVEKLPSQTSSAIKSAPGKGYLASVLKRAADVFGLRHNSDEVIDLPDVIFTDHRDECMFRIRDQGKCGSCYSFAIVAQYEWLYCHKTKKNIAFSEQYFVDCGGKFEMAGCDGGYYHAAPDFVHEQGLELRSNYPYRARADTCPFTRSTPSKAKGYLRVTTTYNRYVDLVEFNRELKESPIIVTLYISDNFEEYGGGVDNGFDCKHDELHAVLLVGSGREDNEEYWLFRNSYSADFGERGYYKINKRAKHCIEEQKGFVIRGLEIKENMGINRHYQSDLIQRHQKILAPDVGSQVT